jgi:hypothetical protein
MTDNITYKFCLESIRYAYEIIGYDAIIKELNFIKHLNSATDTHNQNKSFPNIINCSVPEQVDEPIQEKDIKITENTQKNIIIEHKKYMRDELPNNMRCQTILPTGKQCTLKRAEQSNNCTRHTK